MTAENEQPTQFIMQHTGQHDALLLHHLLQMGDDAGEIFDRGGGGRRLGSRR